MRYIDLSKIDATDPEVASWLQQARTKHAELASKPDHASRSAFLSENNLWSDFKPILIRYFGEKCWYSECSLEGSFGDVDHFRPKNQSLDLERNSILDDGYWWLAYEYMNYRLSCEKCNRPFGEAGKGNYFPLKEGSRPAQFGVPCEEAILLLDPCNAADVDLIGFNEEGKVVPLTNDPWLQKRVKCSRWIYNLDLFNNARKKVMARCRNAVSRFDFDYYSPHMNLMGALESLLDLTSGDSAYSAVARQYISLKIEGKPYAEELTQILELSSVTDATPSEERQLVGMTR